MRISDWSSDVCSSDLAAARPSWFRASFPSDYLVLVRGFRASVVSARSSKGVGVERHERGRAAGECGFQAERLRQHALYEEAGQGGLAKFLSRRLVPGPHGAGTAQPPPAEGKRR